MFRKNDRHLQHHLFSCLDGLPKKLRNRLDASWAGTFYRECFMRINEMPFGELYSASDSRPNIPVNVLIGLEILKAGFGWSELVWDDKVGEADECLVDVLEALFELGCEGGARRVR